MKEILMHAIVQNVIPLLVAGVVAGLGWVTKNIATALTSWTKSQNFGRWTYYAGVAVKAVEAKYGPDTATGKQKQADAVKFLLEKTHGQISEAQAIVLVQAAYTDAFTLIQPLKNG